MSRSIMNQVFKLLEFGWKLSTVGAWNQTLRIYRMKLKMANLSIKFDKFIDQFRRYEPNCVSFCQYHYKIRTLLTNWQPFCSVFECCLRSKRPLKYKCIRPFDFLTHLVFEPPLYSINYLIFKDKQEIDVAMQKIFQIANYFFCKLT